MLSTREELLKKLRLGKDSFFDFKEVRAVGSKIKSPTVEAWADEMAAFANSSGGVLLLGVNDNREVVGVLEEHLEAMEEVIQKACQQLIRPPLAPVIEKMTLPDFEFREQPIIRIEVEPSIVVHESPERYPHRIDSAKTRMQPDQLARFFQQRSQARLIRFDETPVEDAPMKALEEKLWRRFAADDTMDTTEVVLHKLALAREGNDGRQHPTISGLLMTSRVSHDYLEGSFIQAVAYRGTTIAPEGDLTFYQQDAQDITGSLDEQILGACDFVRRNMKVSAVKHADGGREDRPQFDMLAVFEAVVNAVAHRDYSMPGSKVRIRLFDDRLEIYSPGMLVNTMSTDSLPYRQAARNEVLTSLLARCVVPRDKKSYTKRASMMDKRGEGVTLILNRREVLSGKRPEYRMLGSSELRVTIYGASSPA